MICSVWTAAPKKTKFKNKAKIHDQTRQFGSNHPPVHPPTHHPSIHHRFSHWCPEVESSWLSFKPSQLHCRFTWWHTAAVTVAPTSNYKLLISPTALVFGLQEGIWRTRREPTQTLGQLKPPTGTTSRLLVNVVHHWCRGGRRCGRPGSQPPLFDDGCHTSVDMKAWQWHQPANRFLCWWSSRLAVLGHRRLLPSAPPSSSSSLRKQVGFFFFGLFIYFIFYPFTLSPPPQPPAAFVLSCFSDSRLCVDAGGQDSTTTTTTVPSFSAVCRIPSVR